MNKSKVKLQITIHLTEDGLVGVGGFPNNLRAAQDIMNAASISVTDYFINQAKAGKLDDKGTVIESKIIQPKKSIIRKQLQCHTDGCYNHIVKHSCYCRDCLDKIEKVLFLRDGGRCQVCGRKLNLTRPNNHPLQATHDHIIPLSKGGENSYRNAQLACRRCNSSVKGDGSSLGGDQMLLFGHV